MGSGIRDELIFVLPMFQAMFQTCFKHGGGQAAPCQLQGHSGRRTKEQSVAARESNFLLPMFQGMFQTCFKHRGGETAPRERRRKRREEDEGGRIIQKRSKKEGERPKGLMAIIYKKYCQRRCFRRGFLWHVSDPCFRPVSDVCFRHVFQTRFQTSETLWKFLVYNKKTAPYVYLFIYSIYL